MVAFLMSHSFSPKAIRKAKVLISGMEAKKEQNSSLIMENESLSEEYDNQNVKNKQLGERLAKINAEITTKNTERQIKLAKIKKSEKLINELKQDVHKNAIQLTSNVFFAKLSHNMNRYRANKRELIQIIHLSGNVNDNDLVLEINKNKIPDIINKYRIINENLTKILKSKQIRESNLISYSNLVESLISSITDENAMLLQMLASKRKINSIFSSKLVEKQQQTEIMDESMELSEISVDQVQKFSIASALKSYTSRITKRVKQTTSMFDGTVKNVGINTEEAEFEKPPMIKIPIISDDKKSEIENLQKSLQDKLSILKDVEEKTMSFISPYELISEISAHYPLENTKVEIQKITKFEIGIQPEISFRDYDFYENEIKKQAKEIENSPNSAKNYQESQKILDEVQSKIDKEKQKYQKLNQNIDKVQKALDTIEYNINAREQVDNEQTKMDEYFRVTAKKLKAQLKLRERVYNIIEDQIEVHQAQLNNLLIQNKKLSEERKVFARNDDAKYGNIQSSARKLVAQSLHLNQKVNELQNEIENRKTEYKDFIHGDLYTRYINNLMKKNSLERRAIRWSILTNQKNMSLLAMESNSKVLIDRRTSLKDLYETRYQDKFNMTMQLKRLEWYSNLLNTMINSTKN